MGDEHRLTNRIQSGEPVEIAEIEGRIDELEADFEDRGFLYTEINGWLIPSLESDPDARELIALKNIHQHLEDAPCKAVTFEIRQNEDAGDPVCELNERYFLNGYFYAVPERDFANKA